ncbi:hypothetical protein DL93DRAFT_2173174 [Clavulina sp. PMI_390]|nr:hypothetical protein DL93DRAFT_2173174 [Clavulina sp. PMI_390]
MAIWADLPTELAINVIQELYNFHSSAEFWHVDKNLLSCTYVSRQFRSLVEPFLYRDICLIDPDFWGAKQARDPFRPLQQLTRTFILRPDLAQYVRVLQASSSDDDYEDYDTFMLRCNFAYDKDRTDKYLSAASEAVRGDIQHILPALDSLGLKNGLVLRGGTNGIMLVLLHLLPRLETLEMTCGSEVELFSCSCFGVFSGRIPPGLNSVSDFTVYYKHTMDGMGVNQALPFMTLPSMKAITSGTLTDGDPDSRPALEISGTPPSISSASHGFSDIGVPINFYKTSTGYGIPLRSSSVTNITLLWSLVSSAAINSILSLPYRLERFEYSVGTPNVDYVPFCPASFLPGLLGHASSLRELEIQNEFGNGEDQAFIGSLSELAALEILSLPARLLLPDFNDNDEHSEYGDETDDAAVPRNPMDNLLPKSLISLHCNLKRAAFGRFRRRTGVPQSLSFSRQHLPSFVSLTIGEQNLQADDPSLRNILQQTPALQPPMKLNLFGTKN